MMGPEEFAPIQESSDAGATGAEQSSEKSERFSEQYRQAQARLAGMKKDEKKTKKRDKSLAALLTLFIKENKDEQIVNTLVSLLKEDVLPEFLLGILSLYYPNVKASLYEEEQQSVVTNPRLLLEAKQLTVTIQKQRALAVVEDFDEHNLPEAIKQAINIWVQDMLFTSFLHPTWLLPRVYAYGEVHTTVIQLATFLVERFLMSYHIKGDFTRIRQFTSFILRGVLQETHKRQGTSSLLS